MKTISVHCKNINRYIEVEGGSTLAALARALRPELGFEPICARVNNKTEGLSFAIFQPKQIEFHSNSEGSGQRVYIRSLCMVLYRAITDLFPGATLRFEHSISRGYYGRLLSEGNTLVLSDDQIGEIRRAMRRIGERDIPFERKEKLTTDVIEIFRHQGLYDKCLLLETLHSLYTTYYVLDGVADSYYGALAPSTGHLRVFDLQPYKEGFLLTGIDPANPDVPAQPVTQEKMYHAFTEYLHFNRIVGVSDVGQMNRQVIERRTSDLINLAEALHSQAISRISDEIARRYHEGGARIILVAGPSSSGKTTTAKRLAIQLMTHLLKPQTISLDDYFVDRVNTPRDETGDYDYESLYALDLAQFNRDLNAIIAAEEVELPSYNFETGSRQYKGNRVRHPEGGVLVI